MNMTILRVPADWCVPSTLSQRHRETGVVTINEKHTPVGESKPLLLDRYLHHVVFGSTSVGSSALKLGFFAGQADASMGCPSKLNYRDTGFKSRIVDTAARHHIFKAGAKPPAHVLVQFTTDLQVPTCFGASVWRIVTERVTGAIDRFGSAGTSPYAQHLVGKSKHIGWKSVIDSAVDILARRDAFSASFDETPHHDRPIQAQVPDAYQGRMTTSHTTPIPLQPADLTSGEKVSLPSPVTPPASSNSSHVPEARPNQHEHRLNAHEIRLDSHQGNIDRLHTRAAHYEDGLKSTSSQTRNLSGQTSTLHTCMDQHGRLMRDLDTKVHNCSEDIEKLFDEVDELSAVCDELTASVDLAKTTTDHIAKEVIPCLIAKSSSHDEQLKANESRISNLSQSIDHRAAAIVNELLPDLIAQVSSQEKQCNETQSGLRSLGQNVDTLQERASPFIDKIAVHDSQLSDLSSRQIASEVQSTQLCSRLDQAVVKVDSLGRKVDRQSANLAAQIAALAAQIQIQC